MPNMSQLTIDNVTYDLKDTEGQERLDLVEDKLDELETSEQTIQTALERNVDELNRGITNNKNSIAKTNDEIDSLENRLERNVDELNRGITNNKNGIAKANDEIDSLENRVVVNELKLNDKVVHLVENPILNEAGEIVLDESGQPINDETYRIVTDKSLSESDIPADAKAVGDLKAALRTALERNVDELNRGITNNKNGIAKANDEIDSLENRVVVNELKLNDKVVHLVENPILNEAGEIVLDESGQPINDETYRIVTDKSLSESDIPADAAITGSKIENLKSRLSELDEYCDINADKENLVERLDLYGDISEMTKSNAVPLTALFRKEVHNCTCKWQGSSSLRYPKKNYTIKFDDAFVMADGWGRQKKYCLKANWIDYSHLRNVCSAKLWNEIVRTYMFPTEELSDENGDDILAENGSTIDVVSNMFLSAPNCGAIDGFPIRLYINGKYTGLYSMNIPKDGWMFNMGSGDSECILCAENPNQTTIFDDDNYGYASVGFRAATAVCDGSDFSIEYASDEDDVDWVPNSLNNAITAVLESTEQNFEASVSPYVDLKSAMDYLIYTCLLHNCDGQQRNFLLVTFNGVKWYFSVYDLDAVLGNNPSGSGVYKVHSYPYTSNTHTNFYTMVTFAGYASVNTLMSKIVRFMPETLKARYTELREGVLSEENVSYLFEKYSYKFTKGLLNDELKIWPEIPGTINNNISQILNFYRMKTKALDREIAAL